ncbi:MAG: DUF2268 domain-containing putative Zn-dependent protease [Treponema sp.]|jgi:hypothetical protein|nr:DUF2268 domain-containing putative Zn-dependent protease [Treponema sp.]
MKKTPSSTFVTALTLSLALLFAACSSPLSLNLNHTPDKDKEARSFYAVNIVTNKFYSINAEKLAEGEHCIVYADEKENVSHEAAEAIVREYEANIYTQITDAFGMFEDVDDNGKVILLLLDIIDGYTQSSYVAGFFQAYHLFKKSTYPYHYSNEADMLFLDTNPQQVGSESFYSTIAHELQHLINFSQTAFNDGGMEDTWIDEGLATAAEYVYNGHQKTRINFFNQDPYRSIKNGNNFFVWDGGWESGDGGWESGDGAVYDPVANYATAYLFFQWLRIHAHNGIGIYKDIIGSSYRDYRAVTEAAGSRIDNSLGDWETLLRTWMLANAYNQVSGLLGYKGEIETKFHYFTEVSRKLAPGEGVFSPIALEIGGSFTGSDSGNIRYVELNTSSIEGEPDTLLMFNANSNNTDDSEIGYLVQGEEHSARGSLSVGRTLGEETEPALRGPFPIDVPFNPDGTKRRRQ